MAQPLSPSLMPNFDFIETYMDCLESLPLELQRFITQIREFDVVYRMKLQQLRYLSSLYRSEESETKRRRLLSKVQKCLLKSQQYSDEKLNLITQMFELTEARNLQLSRDADAADVERKDDVDLKIPPNKRLKLEKPMKVNNLTELKGACDKPKRPRRARALNEKVEKTVTKDELEDDEMEEADDEEAKMKNNGKRKEKVKEKCKEEDRRVEKKTPSKVSKKVKHMAKKKKKKEKERNTEDIAVDPDEPVYCLCNSISYGDMIGCDNDDCPIEWFHFGCVNLTHKPKGKWYCPSCTVERKNKK